MRKLIMMMILISNTAYGLELKFEMFEPVNSFHEYDDKLKKVDLEVYRVNNCSEYSDTECFRLWSNLGEME